MRRFLLVSCLASGVGCAGQQVVLPAGHLPAAATTRDARTAEIVATGPALPATKPGPAKPFDLPPGLTGSQVAPPAVPRLDPNMPAAERDRLTRAAYPTLTPVSAELPAGDRAVSLAELQELARTQSPVVARAQADAAVSYGRVVQAGLYPNPTVGYQADQVQPGPRPLPLNNPGQQGGFINQLIKTAGKLTLAQRVAGYDYVNALVAVRRAEVDVTAAVRTQYFAALVAQESLRVNGELARVADEVYDLQLRKVAAGLDEAYRPRQLYIQAVQARNAILQAQATYRAAWRQLAAAVGQPDLPQGTLAGRADGPAPVYDADAVRPLLENHTDLLTARNSVGQAYTNLTLQRRLPIPDLQTNQYHQYDNVAQNYQFGIQLGVNLPISDRNQGNVRAASAQIASSTAGLAVAQNNLVGRLAEAFARYDANRQVAANYRDKILPNFIQAYRAIALQFQAEPEKVSFSDIVVAQQNVGVALQAYLAALGAQWQGVVDVAAVLQLDELYLEPAPPPAAPAPAVAVPPPAAVVPAPRPAPR